MPLLAGMRVPSKWKSKIHPELTKESDETKILASHNRKGLDGILNEEDRSLFRILRQSPQLQFSELSRKASRDGKLDKRRLRDIRDGEGHSLLHVCAIKGHLEVMQKLIDDIKIDIDCEDLRGWTAL